MSLSVASLTWADTASDSNADYEFKSVSQPMIMAAASAYDSPVYARVGNSFTRLQYDSTMTYVTIPANADCLRWDVNGSYGLLVEPVDSSNLSMFYQVQEKHTEDGTAHWSTYNISDFKNGNAYHIGAEGDLSIYLMMSNVTMSTKMKVLLYPTSNLSNMKVRIGGVYDENDKQIFFSNQQGGRYLRCIGPVSSSKYSIFRFPSGGKLKKGYEYTFTFYAEYAGHYVYTDQWGNENVTRDGKYYTFTINPTRDMDLSEIPFCILYDASIKYTGTWYYVSSSSTYIPAADTGQQGQVTAANTTVIKNVVTNISNTVSNISNQITNTTNTITNTITNTTNQIKQAVNQSADKISQTVTNTSNQIKDSVNQSAEKISQTVTNKVNEVNGTINSVGQKTQEKIDDMQKSVVDKLEDTKTGIITGIIDGLKSLFIPSDDFFKTWFDDMYSFFDERLGFLMLPVDLLVNLIDIVVSADSSNAGIPFPEIKWEGTVLIPAQTVRIEIFDTDFGKDLQDKLYFVGNVIMIGALLSLMYRKFEEVLRS